MYYTDNQRNKKYTQLVKQFRHTGTIWTKEIRNIIETPLFVDSELTSMVQLADLCGYALRQYLEKNEVELFNEIYKCADRKVDIVVGVRHFTRDSCSYEICRTHKSTSKTLFGEAP
ncbi:MAG: DUF3800 domain-containing protein [Bacteroidota bacterium]|nr:DUF3800 domain-containing protein [Bacteroidota bacterium]